MIFGVKPYGFIVPGYANKAMTPSEQVFLTDRFIMKGDFGVASNGEKAANMEAFKRGGEVVGRYLFKGEEWVAWAEVAPRGGKPDLSPGLLLHAKEYRDGWHRGPENIKPSPDHPTELLRDDNPDDDADITIVAPRAKD